MKGILKPGELPKLLIGTAMLFVIGKYWAQHKADNAVVNLAKVIK